MTKKTNTFGDRLRARRKELGLSQDELATKTGIHNVHISRYENDKVQPAATNVRKLADVLQTTTDFLLDGSTDAIAEDRLSDKELLRQFQEVEKFPEADKSHIKRMLRDAINGRKLSEMAAV